MIFIMCLLIYLIIGSIIGFIIMKGIDNNVNGAKKQPNDLFIWTIVIFNMLVWPATLFLLIKNMMTGKLDNICENSGKNQDLLLDQFNSYFEDES